MADKIKHGLEGVLVAESELSVIDGQAGELRYRGYPIRELAAEATFEEVVYLLWHGSLPTRSQLATFSRELCDHREIDDTVLRTLEDALLNARQRQYPYSDIRFSGGRCTL
jgi:citrate synthase